MFGITHQVVLKKVFQKMVGRSVCFLLFLCIVLRVDAQNSVADFTVTPQACLQQNIKLINQSTSASRVEWDLCQGDLSTIEGAGSVLNLLGSITTGVDIVFDGTNWFGFIANQNADNILRLDFGNDINSIPQITNLGGIGGVMKRPTDIKIVNDNGSWFGFVYGLQSPMISRIDFGNSLTNTTTSPNPISAQAVISGAGATNGGFDMMYDGNNWIIVLTNNIFLDIVRLSSINSTPATQDIISGITNSFGNGMGDIVLVKSNSNYYGYVVAYANKSLQRLEFGNSLFSAPSITNITSALPAGPTPYGIDAGFDNNHYYVFISTLEGNLIRIDLGADLSQSPGAGVALGSFSALENTLKIKLIRDKTTWRAFSPSWSSSQLYRVNFMNPVCDYSDIVTNFSPVVAFSQAGVRGVTLRSFGGGGYSEISKPIDITGNTAPQVTINYQGACITTATSFSLSPSEPLLAHHWEFGDEESSTDLAPSHQYSSAGNYDVALSVTGANGCSNFVSEHVKMFGLPGANFDVPPGLICTNNNIAFINTTPDDGNASMAYQWYVDGEDAGTEQNLDFFFTNTGSRSIKLVAANLGCSDFVTKSTSFIEAGPAIDFLSAENCEETAIQFTNQILEEVTDITWDFGDDTQSSSENPSHVFASAGNYEVTLMAVSPNGCNNSKTRKIQVYSKPTPSFSIEAPPQSCSGAATPFQNTTPDLTDSNITSWRWTFGDANSSSNISELKSPSHIFANAGTYKVLLKAKTDKECEATLEKEITIAQSPNAEFSNTATCKESPSTFTSSGADIETYYWEIGTSYYLSKSVNHTFNTSGEHDVKLFVTGTNNCNSFKTKRVKVPVPLTPSFSVWKNCVGYEAEFTDNTSGADPVAWRQWNFDGLIKENVQKTKFPISEFEVLPTTLTVKGESGCVYSKRMDVNVFQAPVANFEVTPLSGAAPLEVSVKNLSESATKYKWTFFDATNSTSEEFEPTFTYNQIGEHKIELKAGNQVGCEHTISKTIIAESPAADVEIKVMTVSQNPDKTLKVIVTLQNNGNTILRDLPVNIDISGVFSFKEIIEEPIRPKEQYNLVLSYGITRSQDLNFLCAQTELMNDLNFEGNKVCTQFEKTILLLSPYPNPVTEMLNIEWIGKVDHRVNVLITDSFGKAILQKDIDSIDGFNHQFFDVTQLKEGLYFLVINDGATQKTQRIIISRKN